MLPVRWELAARSHCADPSRASQRVHLMKGGTRLPHCPSAQGAGSVAPFQLRGSRQGRIGGVSGKKIWTGSGDAGPHALRQR